MSTRIRIWAAWAATLPLTAIACTTDGDELATTANPVTSRGDTLVSLAMARAVAEIYQVPGGGPARTVRTSSVKLDAGARPVLYGFGFLEGGFAVVSAEYEFAPILAFADTGTIDVANPLPGLADWQEEMRLAMEAVRARSPLDDAELQQRIAADLAERDGWQPLLDLVASRTDVDAAEVTRARQISEPDICFECPPPPPACTSYTTTTRGPLVAAQWNQACNSYNAQTPPTSNSSLCYHSPTGCSPTAMGQIVHYHRHAANRYYDWNMPLGASGTTAGLNARADLLSDLGVQSNTAYGYWSSSTSIANTRSALQSFGYAVSQGSLPYGMGAIAIPEVKANRPLLVAGWSTSGTGHIWVVDGTKVKKGSPEGCKPKLGTVMSYYHYNWGWGGVSNGWYKDQDYGGYSGSRQYMTARPI